MAIILLKSATPIAYTLGSKNNREAKTREVADIIKTYTYHIIQSQESQDEDNLKRSQYCVCNKILCNCDEDPESKSLLDNCWVEN